MTKGADSIMAPLITKTAVQSFDMESMQEQLDAYAREGLRTLVMGQRIMSQ